MSKNINDASLANLKHFEGKWKHGATKTIRVPIALADRVLALARQLDQDESLDTRENTVRQLEDRVLYDRIGQSDAKCRALQQELDKMQKSLDTAESRIAELDLDRRQPSHNSHTAKSRDTSDNPDAADLLNQLKLQSKKSKATLADVELLLSLIFT